MAGRILIVEDDPDLRHLYGTTLILAGYTVELVDDGFAALQHVEQNPPDLLLLDLGLPMLRGEHVANEVAAHAHTRDIPVVVVTGEPLVAPAPAACVLRKPVELDELVRTVRRCLRAAPAPVDPGRRAAKKSIKRG